jgi:subtilase family serine protease
MIPKTRDRIFVLMASPLLWFLLLFASGTAQSARAQALAGPPPDRIVQSIDNARMSVVKGNLHPQARAEFDQGDAEPSLKLQNITMTFKPTAAQQAAVDALLAAQQDRSSPNYHRWLTPDEFAGLSGISQNDLNKIAAWLTSQGFQVRNTASSRTWISFSGTAQQVQAAFHARMHRYLVNGEIHHANATEPAVPGAFAGVVLGFRGLSDFRPNARGRASIVAGPRFTSSVSGNHFLAPGDFATIYDLNPLYSAGINGTGQKIAVMGQTDIVMTDIATFRTLAGLPANNPQIVLPSSDPGTSQNDLAEADLDLEWSGAVARNATIIYVNSSNAFDSLIYAVDHNVAPVISISYGLCEPSIAPSDASFIAQLAQQANAQGMTIVAPSGDSGAADCDAGYPATQGLAVDFPASLPYVTGVGGTEFNEGAGTYWNPSTGNTDNVNSAISYIPEIVWNDTPPPSACTGSGSNCALSAPGGGASTIYTKPTWQQGAGVPADGARDVPDVSIAGSPDHDGYLICSNGSCVVGWRMSANGNLNVIGGTSMGVPTFAGIVALINQQAGTPQGQGNINYILYPLAANVPSAFHDVTSGNNIVPCQSGSTGCTNAPSGSQFGTIGYPATAGYDLASGWGSIDAYNLVTSWSSISSSNLLSSSVSGADFQLEASPAKLTLAPSSSASAQVTLTPINGFTVVGTPAFTCTVATLLTGVTCTVTAGAAPNTWTVMIQASATAEVGHPAGFSGEFGGFAGRLAAGVILAGLLLFFLTGNRGVQRELSRRSTVVAMKRWNLAAGLALLCILALTPGCSNSNKSSSGANGSGSAAQPSAAVTIQGTVAGISHSVQIGVTIN